MPSCRSVRRPRNPHAPRRSPCSRSTRPRASSFQSCSWSTCAPRGLFFDPDSLGFVIKNWRGEKHPRYVETSPGAPSVALAIGERRRIVYVGLTRAKGSLYVTAPREEQTARDVGVNGLDEHDHFAETLSWALANPHSASVVEAEQLELPVIRAANGHVDAGPAVVAAGLDRLEHLPPPGKG